MNSIEYCEKMCRVIKTKSEPLENADKRLLKVYKIAKEASDKKNNISKELKKNGYYGKGGSTNTYDVSFKKAWIDNKMVGEIDPNGSQNNIDIGSTEIGEIEVKSSKTGNFMLNDSTIKPNVWYILESNINLILIHGSCLPGGDLKLIAISKIYKDVLRAVGKVFKKYFNPYYQISFPRPGFSMSPKVTNFLPSGIFDGETYYIDGDQDDLEL